jgi:hypothetical protein
MRPALVILTLLYLPTVAMAVPMEVRVTGTILNGFDNAAPTFGTPTPSLFGYAMDLRLYYDSDLLPADADPGPGAAYGYAPPSPDPWLTGTLTVNGVTVALDLTGFGRISAYQASETFEGPVAAFFMSGGDLRSEPFEASDNEFFEFNVFDTGQFSDAAPFDPAGTYEFASVAGPGNFDGLLSFQSFLRIVGDPIPGAPVPPRWNDGQFHVIEIGALDDPTVRIAPVPAPAAVAGFLSAFAALAGVSRARSRRTHRGSIVDVDANRTGRPASPG